MKLSCPLCGKQAMSAAQKLWLGPARTTRCRSCSENISVPMTAWFAMMIPVIAGTLVGVFLFPTHLMVAVFGLGAALVGSMLHLMAVPLVSKE